MDRLERLVNLVAALIEAERPLSREQVHQRVGGYAPDVETFRRNFERDKDLLRQMGFPLVLEPLDSSRPDGPQGYRIPRERYELPDPGLSGDELAALHLAASSVSIEGAWGRDASTTALRKLAATTGVSAAPPPQPNGHHTDGRHTDGRHTDGPRTLPATILPTDERVAAVFGAVAARQAVRFGYRGAARTVDPWHLLFRRGQWYLSGRDHDRDEERMFRLDRVDGDVEAYGPPGAFRRPAASAAAGPPPPWRLGDEPEVVADLRVDPEQADWAVAAAGSDTPIEREPGGAVRLALTVTNRSAFRSFVLGFLEHAEVLGPPELRDDLVAWLTPLTGRAG